MNYAELLQAARGQMGPCRACPVCNGRACGGNIPGPGQARRHRGHPQL